MNVLNKYKKKYHFFMLFLGPVKSILAHQIPLTNHKKPLFSVSGLVQYIKTDLEIPFSVSKICAKGIYVTLNNFLDTVSFVPRIQQQR